MTGTGTFIATRRDKIIAAAESLFSRYGFKAVTMEMVAGEAQVAKGTVYANFANKDAVFHAVAENLASRLLAAVSAELGRKGDVVRRVSAALAAKHAIVFHLVRTSPHAAELFAASGALVGDLFEAADREIIDLVAEALTGSGRPPGEAAETARLAFAAATGIANAAPTVEQLETDVGTVVRKLLA